MSRRTGVGGVAPVAGDDGRINNGGTAIIDSSQNISMLLVVVADTNGTTGTLRMTGGTLTTTSDIRAGGNSTTVVGGTGRFDQSGGTININAGGNFNVGIGPTNTTVGTYNLSGGSVQLNAANPIFAVGNRAVGSVNQSGGTIYLRNTSGLTQLGRNAAAGSGFGTYNLGGGTLATSRLQFGNAVGTGPVSTNVFNLSTNGVLLCGSISNINTTAVNSFNFTGGTLTVMTCAISLTNNGGTLSPAAIDFASAAGTNLSTLPVNAVGTNIFTGANSYVQSSGTLAIDIAGPGNNDFVDIGSGANVGNATIAGTISVRLLNGYAPAVGTTFDILAADLITDISIVTANNDAEFAGSIAVGADGRQILRLVVTKQAVSAPQLTGATRLGNGSFRFSFTNSISHAFNVWSTTNLANSFSLLGTATESSPGQYEFTDSQASGLTQRFYQVRWP